MNKGQDGLGPTTATSLLPLTSPCTFDNLELSATHIIHEEVMWQKKPGHTGKFMTSEKT